MITISLICSALTSGCTEQPYETREIVDNLVNAGFPADDIAVVEDVVYVGRDAEVSLAASREMLQPGNDSREHYRTANVISPSLQKICVDGSTFTGVFSTALDLTIQNYDEQPLSFAMARTPSSGCGFTINAVIQPGLVGGSAGFPSGGLPFPTITIGGGLSTYSVDTIEHVITHELGHTIGFRHSDYYNRSISCYSGGNEGGAGIGAIHVPGTPVGATVGGSIMNSCFRTFETGELTDGDKRALRELYMPGKVGAIGDFDGDGQSDILWRNAATNQITIWLMSSGQIRAAIPMSNPGNDWQIQGSGDFDGNGKADIFWRNADGTGAIWFMNGGVIVGTAYPWGSGGNNDWQIQGFADFNGNGKTDILWRHVDGSGAIHFMDGGTKVGEAYPWGSGGNNDWQIQGTGDFNGDGKADVLWRHINGAGAIHFMNGGTKVGEAYPWGSVGNNDWQIQGIGDFDGNGRPDILWRHLDGTGAIHFMNGGIKVGEAYPWGAGGNNDWQIQGTGRFNANATADILWRHLDGGVAIHFMNGGTKVGEAYPVGPS